jgi:hypothetical protein
MVDQEAVRRALSLQAQACAALGAPFSAAVLRRAADDLDRNETLSRLFSPWGGAQTRAMIVDAVALRFLGSLHDLALSGAAPDVSAAWPSPAREGDAGAAWEATMGAMPQLEARLAAFMAHEPQTNEVRRSICLLPGFLTIGNAIGPELRCFEIGASAGLNQIWDRYRYEFGACTWGPSQAPLMLDTAWRGTPPPTCVALRVQERGACDRRPIDLTDTSDRRRLKAFIWADQFDRLERYEAAAATTVAAGFRVEEEDAVTWAARCAGPTDGAATVLYHSIFWQYLTDETRQALTAAIVALGARATRLAPFSWLRMEPVLSDVTRVELRLTQWPGGEERLLAEVHPHGAWVNWRG